MKENKYASLKLFLLRSKLLLIFGAVFIVGSIIFVPKIFAELQPVGKIEIFSEKLNYKEKEPGSWKITKSAKWTGKGEAEITFDLETILKEKTVKGKNILFVIDTFGSMAGEKMERVKSDATNLVNDLLSNSTNKVGIITFSTSSTKVLDLTNDKNLILEKLNSILAYGGTNYYQALLDVDAVLKDVISDNETLVLFLTDGFPNEDTPNEEGQFNYLKRQYPKVVFNGIQYEMGKDILDPIKNISDNQFIADVGSLNNVLFEAAKAPVSYTNFEISDFVNNQYFYVDKASDIKLSHGDYSFDKANQKVTWNIDDLKSGIKSKMTIKVKLKDELIGKAGIYSTNTEENINSKLESVLEDVSSAKTPVLKDNYQVKYDGNAPDDCSVSGVPDNEHYSVYDTVAYSDKKPTCNGYQFMGWKITTKDITKVNDDYFIMPEEDVEMKATWSRLKIKKSMTGKIKENLTLYKQVEEDASDETKFVKKYTGDTSTFNGNENVYYYYGNASNNNVVFANYCWKIVRTTDTGGVKLLCNGVPSNDGTCDNSGTASQLTAEQMGTDSANVLFNSFGYSSESYSYPLASVGYMYNEYYVQKSKSFWLSSDYFKSESDYILYSKDMGSGADYTFYYSDSLDTSISWAHSLKNPKLYEWSANYKNLVGKYTAFDKDASQWYGMSRIIKTTPTKVYYVYEKESLNIKLATNYKTNTDGTYSLVNPITITKANWIDNYNKYINYYLCKGGLNTTCSDMYQIYGRSDDSHVRGNLISSGMRFGNSFTYSGGKYTLKNAKTILTLDDYAVFSNYHYTCLSKNDACDEVAYIYSSSGLSGFYYITLKDGESIENALYKMFKTNVNKNDSNVKATIDKWYSKSMVGYTDYLEDTVWCNDRGISSLGAYNPNGGPIDFSNSERYLRYKSYVNTSDLTCSNNSDSFTVNANNGNGALTYPVGMITRQEYDLSYDSESEKNSLNSDSYSWLLSPSYDNSMYVTKASNSGYGVQPSVSLKAGISYSAGDGSVNNPYVVLAE